MVRCFFSNRSQHSTENQFLNVFRNYNFQVNKTYPCTMNTLHNSKKKFQAGVPDFKGGRLQNRDKTGKMSDKQGFLVQVFPVCP